MGMDLLVWGQLIMHEVAGLIVGKVKKFFEIEVRNCIVLTSISGASNAVVVSTKDIFNYKHVLSIWHTHNSYNFFPSLADCKCAIKLKKKNISYMTIYATKLEFAMSYKVCNLCVMYIIVPIFFVNNKFLSNTLKERIKQSVEL
jgi:hypothetical protein